MHRSALRLHSRDHDSSIRVACRSRAPCRHGGGPLRFYAYRSAWRLRSRHYGRSVPAAHGSRPLEEHLEGPFLLSDRFSMLFVFLCSHAGRAGNRTVMRTCNICTLNIPTWHIDKKSIKIAKKYVPRACSNCSLRM